MPIVVDPITFTNIQLKLWTSVGARITHYKSKSVLLIASMNYTEYTRASLDLNKLVKSKSYYIIGDVWIKSIGTLMSTCFKNSAILQCI